MEYLSPIVFYTAIMKMLLKDERIKKCGFVSILNKKVKENVLMGYNKRDKAF